MQLAEGRKWHSDTCTGDRGDVQHTLVTCTDSLVIDGEIVFDIPLHRSGLKLSTLFVLGIFMLMVVFISFLEERTHGKFNNSLPVLRAVSITGTKNSIFRWGVLAAELSW